MRKCFSVVLLAALAAGCTLHDENPDWAPKRDLPAWTYDAPFYYRPSEDLPVAETVAGGVPIYYPNTRQFFLKHPAGYQLAGAPRMAVWYSTTEGRRWRRAGFFGVEQTHFLFEAEQDGPHWVRFVGPGQPAAGNDPAGPQRIYVVDTAPPNIQITVKPPPIEIDEKGNEHPRIYKVGEEVTVTWRVNDPNLTPDIVRLATTFAAFPANVLWSEFPEDLADTGSMTVPIVAEAAENGSTGLRLRVTAEDKAGNKAMVFSEVLNVARTTGATTKPFRAAGTEAPTTMIAQSDGHPGERPGWPEPGTMIRGGTTRLLAWLPEETGKHKDVMLQFSTNNGRSWRTVAKGLQLGQTVTWTVPEVNSKLCLLRVVALEAPEARIMLATSASFTVQTAPKDIRLGPEKLEPESRAD